MSSIRELALARAIGGGGGGGISVESLSVTENGTYTAPSGKAYSPVTVDVQPELEPLSVTENGTYTPETGVDGFSSVSVNVSGGGGIPLMTTAQWNALTKAKKQAYGLVAIQSASTGYVRGELINGADYNVAKVGEYTPSDSWNQSINVIYTYNFAATTPTGNNTLYCLAAMTQNGNNPSYASDLPIIAYGFSGNGSYAIVYGDMNSSYASTYSAGDNWNNSEIVCFCFSGSAYPIIKELFYEQGQTGTYTYTYQASGDENLLLIAMRGGSLVDSYTITGLTQKSHVTSSGARFNDVYFGAVGSGDEVSITIPYAAGASGNGSLFVALLSVEVDS